MADTNPQAEDKKPRSWLAGGGNIHSQNMVRALLWLMERELVMYGDREAHNLEGAAITERLREDVRLIEWQLSPHPKEDFDG